jgi:UDP-glucose 4-epimerase
VKLFAWVLGEGGLLGAHVAQALDESPRFERWRSESAFAWEDQPRLASQLAAAAGRFATALAGHGGEWSVFWCAGAGVVGTSARALAGECAAWERLLEVLGRVHAESAARGVVFLASSAGGIYAGSRERPLTESSTPFPLSAYGEAKLRQERALAEWAVERDSVSTLVARFSNLYGPGQNLDKPQGLVARISQCLLHGHPAHVYVPMDTTRDYVFAADAARAVVRWSGRLADEAARAGTASHLMKICASGTATSVAQVIGAFRQTARRPLRIVTALHPAGREQPRHLQFRSIVWPDEPAPAQTSLPAGIHRLHSHQLALFQRGKLPSVAPAGRP